jgi:hypothetical protein
MRTIYQPEGRAAEYSPLARKNMKEHGIPFKPEMVIAISSGNKTMTRRTSERWKKARPGDRLWVKETFAIHEDFVTKPQKPVGLGLIFYRADDWPCPPIKKWKPSRFMPRWASRITIDLIAVRQERLQDISIQDAIDEGYPGEVDPQNNDPIGWYREIWESINGPGSWDANPEVTVLEWPKFKAVK